MPIPLFSTRLGRLVLKSALLLLAAVTVCACTRSQEKPEYAAIFDEFGVEGSFMAYDLNNDSYTYYNRERCSQQFLPASTFKVFNALVALETGVIADADEILPWDGKTWQFASWNQDHNLRTAMQHSVIWFYQEMARRIGRERMQHYVDAAGYGNADISGSIDTFWLEGGLRISQEEQIDFLRRLYQGDLPFSERSMDIVREIIVLEETASYRLSGKTGQAMRVETQVGWFVGYLEQGDNVYFFATNIVSDSPGDDFGRARIEITRRILPDLGWQGQSQGEASSFRPAVPVAWMAGFQSEDVGWELLDRWLDHFSAPEVGRKDRLTDYAIHEVALESSGEDQWLLRVSFSVQPAAPDSNWIAGNGVMEDSWIRNKLLFVTVIQEDGVYRLGELATMP